MLVRTERQHEDQCGHEENEYIGSVFHFDKWHDIYLYTDRGDPEMSCCFRYGSDGPEYISPTWIRYVRASVDRNPEHYGPFLIFIEGHLSGIRKALE